MAIEALYHGNADAKDAQIAKDKILEMVEASVPAGGGGLAKKKFPSHPVTKVPFSVGIPKVVIPVKDLTDPNTAVELYIQVVRCRSQDPSRESVAGLWQTTQIFVVVFVSCFL